MERSDGTSDVMDAPLTVSELCCGRGVARAVMLVACCQQNKAPKI